MPCTSVSVVPSAVQDEVSVRSPARSSVGGREKNPAGDSKEASCAEGGNALHFSSSASQLSIPVPQPPTTSLGKAWATGTYTLLPAPPRRESEPSSLSTSRMFPFSREQAWVADGMPREKSWVADGMPREQAWVAGWDASCAGLGFEISFNGRGGQRIMMCTLPHTREQKM